MFVLWLEYMIDEKHIKTIWVKLTGNKPKQGKNRNVDQECVQISGCRVFILSGCFKLPPKYVTSHSQNECMKDHMCRVIVFIKWLVALCKSIHGFSCIEEPSSGLWVWYSKQCFYHCLCFYLFIYIWKYINILRYTNTFFFIHHFIAPFKTQPLSW